jgi:hypothetical protein
VKIDSKNAQQVLVDKFLAEFPAHNINSMKLSSEGEARDHRKGYFKGKHFFALVNNAKRLPSLLLKGPSVYFKGEVNNIGMSSKKSS